MTMHHPELMIPVFTANKGSTEEFILKQVNMIQLEVSKCLCTSISMFAFLAKGDKQTYIIPIDDEALTDKAQLLILIYYVFFKKKLNLNLVSVV